MQTDDVLTFIKNLSGQSISDTELERIFENPGFGKYFVDTIVSLDYTPEHGWHNAQILPFTDFYTQPNLLVLHYAQEIFEGLKAYRTKAGKIVVFRPEKNAQRFRNSAKRMCMAELPEDLFVQAVKEFLRFNNRWVPSFESQKTLYIRPFMFASQTGIGVTSSSCYKFMIIASPVGNYSAGIDQTDKLWVSENYVRAVRGGTGEAKCGGNYAAGMIGFQEAKQHGCDQVLWLDGVERKYLEEVGTMNLMIVSGEKDETLIETPALNGSILPGITRDSLLLLAPSLGIKTKETRISLESFKKRVKSGEIKEVFGCGTAAVITPVGEVRTHDDELLINSGKVGPVTKKLYEALVGIQTGVAVDKFGWLHEVS